MSSPHGVCHQRGAIEYFQSTLLRADSSSATWPAPSRTGVICACTWLFVCLKGAGNKLNNGVLSLISTVKEKQSYLGLAQCQRVLKSLRRGQKTELKIRRASARRYITSKSIDSRL